MLKYICYNNIANNWSFILKFNVIKNNLFNEPPWYMVQEDAFDST